MMDNGFECKRGPVRRDPAARRLEEEQRRMEIHLEAARDAWAVWLFRSAKGDPDPAADRQLQEDELERMEIHLEAARAARATIRDSVPATESPITLRLTLHL